MIEKRWACIAYLLVVSTVQLANQSEGPSESTSYTCRWLEQNLTLQILASLTDSVPADEPRSSDQRLEDTDWHEHTGAAGAVFRRAGHGLDDFVSDQSFRDQLPIGSALLPTGSAIVTHAFNAGVSKLIHCVGPGVGAMNCYRLLAQTYENAMHCMASENLECVALVSISTGNLRIPCEKAAQVALRTIQKLLVSGTWQGKLAVVCNDDRIYQAFVDEKTAVLKNFNVIPTLPADDSVDLWFA